MSVYTAPSTSFIDTYITAANHMDERRDASNKALLEGATNLVKGGAEAYKWQKRKNIVDEAAELDAKEKELVAEIERLKKEQEASTGTGITRDDYMSAVMNTTGWKGFPYPYGEQKEDSFVAPVGLGIYKRGLL